MRNQVFKKLFSVLLALIMVAGLLPASAMAGGWGAMDVDTTPVPTEAVQPTESAEPTAPTETETPEVTEVPEPTPENPAATVEPTQGEPTAEPTDEGIMPANVMPVQANVELQYRIVHLDCGREYFTKDWIIALINEMADAGYNQLQLAFGNGGFRFYLNDMAIGSHSSDEVKNALEAGNAHYNTYGDDENGPNNQEWITYNPSKNALTETEMNAIIKHAKSKGIEIVPMLNTPGHMHAVLAAMNQLNIAGDLQVSGKHGCLNLSNTEAVAFTKALVEKYVYYFAREGCKFFNFAMDEYSSFDTNFFIYANYLIAYANTKEITPRVFNDALSNGKTNNGFIEGTQVCCWDSIQNTGSYSVINTSHDFYYVSTNENWNLYREGYTFVGEYAEATWIEHAEKFNNNKFLYKGTSSNISPVGSMFCIWCNTPGKNDETQIAQQIRMILRVIGARMQNSNEYKTTDVLVEGGFKANGTINTSGSVSTPPTIKDELGCEGKIDVAIGTSTRIYLPEGIVATWTVTEGKDVVELVAVESDAQKRGEQVVEFADAAPIIGNAVMVKTLKAGTATVIATLEDGTAITATVEVTDNAKETITVVVGKSFEKTIDGKYDGTYNTDKPEIATVTAEYSQTAGVTHYDKAALDAGTFSISNNGNDTNPTMTVTFEDAGNDQYYIKNSSGQYIYPNATYDYYRWSWSYSLGKDKEPVTIDVNNNNIVVRREVKATTIIGTATTTTTYLTLNNSGFGASGNRTNLYIYKRVEQGIDQTKLTFTGHKEGTTTVTIAGVVYTIEVKAAELENVVLPINLWITNTGVVPTNWSNNNPVEFTYSDDSGNRRSIYTLKASHSTVNSPNGISLSSILPKVTGTAKSWDGNTYNVTYWKSAYHTAENRQSTDGWTNYSHKGTKFEYIRFYESSWAYSVDGITWVNIENVGAEAGDTNKNQVCIWYRQVTTVTSEVTTEIVDWGPIKYAANQCLLDFAVKYDGTSNRIPNSFPATGKTIGFDCPTNQAVPLSNGYVVKDTDGTYYRTVYGIAGVETAEYEVYMITLTPSSDSHTAYINNGSTQANYKYKGTEKIAWAKTEADTEHSVLGKISGVQYGGEPFLESVKIYQYQGLLVTYYLRAKQTFDSLTVHYAIQGSGTAFYEYNIAVSNNTFFSENIGLGDPKVGPLKNGTVVNSDGRTIEVSSDLSKLQDVDLQYRYSIYEVVGFWRESEKSIWIYYTFTRDHTYVIDFGLPLEIKLKDFGVTTENMGDIDSISLASMKDKEAKPVHMQEWSHGKAEVLKDTVGNWYVKYILAKPLSNNITIPLYVKFKNRSDAAETLYNANIIPATNVYYEDSFAKFTDGSGTAKDAKWTIVKNDGGPLNEQQQKDSYTNQALEALGQENHNPYGYDPAYDSCTMFSMGSARKVTVTNDMAKDGVIWPTAQFTFKGTGFDIISLTNNTSGAIFVDVTRKVNGEEVKERSVFVDNYYGYSYENGTWKAEPNNPNAIYQVPVIKVSGLDYDEYKVVIKVAYNTFFDDANAGSYSFWLDAVRVYDPAGNTLDNDYVKDREVKPIYVEVRKALIGQDGFTPNGSGLTNGAVFIDGKSTGASIDDYKNFGPNHEVYLARDQAIAFRIVADRIPATVQIGVKLANGSSGELTLSGSNAKFAAYGDADENAKLTLNTATNMYYALNGITWTQEENGSQKSNVIVLTNTGDNSIVSITNVKCTYASITENTTNTVTLAISYDDALMAVDAVNNAITPVEPEPEPEPEPEKTFEPERFEASWSRNVMQGRKSTLTVKTSEDVEAITVDGQTIRSYRTRTERMGFGRRAKRITYREFTYSMVAQESADFSVTAINAEGTESEAITARLTVKTRPNSMRDMWDWFKGWF